MTNPDSAVEGAECLGGWRTTPRKGLSEGMSVSCGSCNKLPQTLRLKTTRKHYLTALEVKSLKTDSRSWNKVSAGWFLLVALGEDQTSCLSSF